MIHQITHKRRLKVVVRGLCLPIIILIFGCSKEIVSEKWIGYYLYPGSDIQFPLYLDIQIQDGTVQGIAFDGSMEKAAITGTVENGSYVLLLHPVKHGEQKNQDVYYRGKRSGDTITIVGEWEHIVGVTGAWASNRTELGPTEAIEP